jgi:hypothetical protein
MQKIGRCSKPGEIAARLQKAHSFESLWMTTVRSERPAPASAALAPSRPPPHNPMRLATPLTCHECGEPGHKRPECPRLSRTKAPAAAHRGAAGPPCGPQFTRNCYTCGEIGQISMRCPQRQMATTATTGPHTDGPSKPTRKKWCVNHQVSSHDTAECKRLPGRTVNQAPVAARSARPESEPALDQTVATMDPDPGAPTHEQLMNLWETTYGLRTAPDTHAFRGTVVMAPTAQSLVYATAASLRIREPTNERIRGRQRNMPLTFLPKDQLKPLASRQSPAIEEPEAPALPRGEDLPLSFEEVPLSFEELPPADLEWQGEELYNVNNPRLAAMQSSLPGNLHSDPTEGFYRSPKIDNTGDRPAL